MAITETEKIDSGGRIGALRPSAELRQSLEEAERCKEYFEREGFIEYLKSVNEVYLENRGSIVGPRLEICSGIKGENRIEDSEFLEMVNSGGGMETSLEWDRDESEKPKKSISVQLNYITKNNLYTMYLSSGICEKQKGKTNSLLFKGRTLQRNFYLNPVSGMSKRIDDLLLTFTEELLESKIL